MVLNPAVVLVYVAYLSCSFRMANNEDDHHIFDVGDTGLFGDRYSSLDHDSLSRRALAGSIFNGSVCELIAAGLHHAGPGNFCIGARSYLRLSNLYMLFQKFESWWVLPDHI